MIKTKFDTREFTKKLMNSVAYSNGFMDGAQLARLNFNQQLGQFIKEALNKYIDSKARMNPESLHHVYEWDQVGSPSSRLFEVNVVPMQTIIKFNIKFLPSSSISPTSDVPFKNKAKIMEGGVDITIEPKNSEMLVFEDGGETIFTKREITVSNPGGSEVVGGFEKVVNDFFTNYLTTGLLKSSGILDGLERPTEYKRDFAKGARGGRSVGVAAGKKYMNIGRAEIQ
jgi:hypothetical protein